MALADAWSRAYAPRAEKRASIRLSQPDTATSTLRLSSKRLITTASGNPFAKARAVGMSDAFIAWMHTTRAQEDTRITSSGGGLRRTSLISLPLQGPLHGVPSAVLVYFLRCLRGGLGTREEETGGDRQPVPVDSAWELRRLRRPEERGAWMLCQYVS
eukprot:scaffold29060_cov140-Isochrysis_galbana.AAC.2